MKYQDSARSAPILFLKTSARPESILWAVTRSTSNGATDTTPASMASNFSENSQNFKVKLTPDLSAVLKQAFGFSSFRPLQREIMEDSLKGRDVFALLPTGGGKSLCYQLPALIRTGLSP